MPTTSEAPPPKSPDRSPHVVFSRIRKVFQDLGILGSNLSLEHEGVWYRVSCDDQAFIVYRGQQPAERDITSLGGQSAW